MRNVANVTQSFVSHHLSNGVTTAASAAAVRCVKMMMMTPDDDDDDGVEAPRSNVMLMCFNFMGGVDKTRSSVVPAAQPLWFGEETRMTLV